MIRPASVLKGVALGVMALWAVGCAVPVTLPYRRIHSVVAVPPGERVVVTVTSTEFDRSQRRRFFDQTQSVLADLKQHDGLLGYSVRFQLFGTRAWTLTVWRDEASRDRFARSPVHHRAMREGGAILKSVRSVSVFVPVEAAPPRWRDAIALVDGPEGARNDLTGPGR